MDPILRRSSFYYVTALLTYMSLMGRFMLTRDWPVFEVIPLFMPIWLMTAMLASEHDERYALLRILPVSDRRVVRTKFLLVASSYLVQWLLMAGAAAFRMRDGIADASTPVYVSLVCSVALLGVACAQIALWRFGFARMLPVFGVSLGVGMTLIILHLVSLKRVGAWPALSRVAVVQWLGGAPVISSVLLVALALAAFSWLMEVGVRVKTSSEAHL